MWSALSAPGRPQIAQSGLPVRIAARLRLYSAASYGLLIEQGHFVGLVCLAVEVVLAVVGSVCVAVAADGIAFGDFGA